MTTHSPDCGGDDAPWCSPACVAALGAGLREASAVRATMSRVEATMDTAGDEVRIFAARHAETQPP